jgi:hypothetical protein
VKILKYKQRLVEFLVALGMIHETAWTGANEFFLPVRTMRNFGVHSNAKVVSIDDELLYIGSDNAYPSFNKEHGVWVDDTTAIEAWNRKYWTSLWDMSKDPKVV